MMSTFIFLLCLVADAACISLAGPTIRAMDLATEVALFREISPEAIIGFAPAPGKRRVLPVADLRRIATSHGVSGDAVNSVCVVREARVLSKAEVAAAIQQALPGPVEVDVLDVSSHPLPPGKVDFPVSRLPRLRAGRDDPVVWRGSIVCGDGRRWPIWARVRLVAQNTVLVTTRELRPGDRIVSGEMQEEKRPGYPVVGAAVTSIRAGMTPKRRIPRGTILRESMFTEPHDVQAGEELSVEVTGSAVHLRFPATAEGSGRLGEVVWVRGPGVGRRFPAAVTGIKQVKVEVDKSARNSQNRNSANVSPRRRGRVAMEEPASGIGN